MKSNQRKNIFDNAGHWVRVGVLSVSTLAPVIDAAVARLRAQQEAEQVAAEVSDAERKKQIAAFAASAQSDVQERLQTIGTALTDVLEDLRERSANQDMLKRANELTEEFFERSNKFSHVLAERGSEFSHELSKRGRKAQSNIAEQDRQFWIALGFGCGLTAAGIVTFILVRRRLRDTDVSADPSIQLSYDANRSTIHVSQPLGEIHGVSSKTSYPESHPFGELETVVDHDGPVSDKSATELAATAQSTPTDATFVGLASTKKYYPVETPLDQLGAANGKPMDVIYFSSEKDAQTQGFTAANI